MSLIASILISLLLFIGTTVATNSYMPKVLVRHKLHRLIKKHACPLSVVRIKRYWCGGELMPRLAEFSIALKDETDNEIFLLPITKLSSLDISLVDQAWQRKNKKVTEIKRMIKQLGGNEGIRVCRFGSASYTNNAVYIFFDRLQWSSSTVPLLSKIDKILEQNKKLKFYYIPLSHFSENIQRLEKEYHIVKEGHNVLYLQLKCLETEHRAMQYVTTFNPTVWWHIYYSKETPQKQIEKLHKKSLVLAATLDKNSQTNLDSPVEKDLAAKRLSETMWKIKGELNGVVAMDKHMELYVAKGLEDLFMTQYQKQLGLSLGLKKNHIFRVTLRDQGLYCCLYKWEEETSSPKYFSMCLRTLHISERKLDF